MHVDNPFFGFSPLKTAETRGLAYLKVELTQRQFTVYGSWHLSPTNHIAPLK